MLRDLLIKEGAVKRGHFVLTSGKESEYYADIKDACAKPEILREIVNEISKKIDGDAVAGVELGAVPIVVAVAYSESIPYFIIRKEAKHGLKKIIIGNISKGSKIDLIEDVVTTGGSVMRAIEILRNEGMEVNKVITVIDREEGGKELLSRSGVELVSLLKIKEIL
ncbi:MAG: orotate phosphoribosyltransferase [Candidatus Thermoplasmatota archaeon]|jgi:orotate phosphoribosyltransferase|nr:orotate phosphoribosyltransferase [Candidatus Thermoplasmatota archaeon]